MRLGRRVLCSPAVSCCPITTQRGTVGCCSWWRIGAVAIKMGPFSIWRMCLAPLNKSWSKLGWLGLQALNSLWWFLTKPHKHLKGNWCQHPSSNAMSFSNCLSVIHHPSGCSSSIPAFTVTKGSLYKNSQACSRSHTPDGSKTGTNSLEQYLSVKIKKL